MYQESPDYLRGLIRKTRTLTDKPFGVGVVLAFPHEENIKAILEEKVAFLEVYWGDCSKELVLDAHSAGVKVIPQVSLLHPFLLVGTLAYWTRACFHGYCCSLLHVDIVINQRASTTIVI